MVRSFVVVLALSIVVALYLQDFDPVASPDFGQVRTDVVINDALAQNIEYLLHLENLQPEHLTWDKEGNMYTGLANGTVLKVKKDGKVKHFAQLGRPLALKFDKDGQLIVADIHLGLVSVDPKGKVHILANTVSVEGKLRKIMFADYLSIASDGKIYFSDASSKYSDFIPDLLEGRPYGSLVVYDPESDKTKVLVNNEMYFTNGVELSRDEEFVLIAETFASRINRYWLKGPKAGTWEVFMDGFPGYPDNISISPRGTLWVAFVLVRPNDLLFKFPLLKKLLYMFPFLIPQNGSTFVAEISIEEKKVLRVLGDKSGSKISKITTVIEKDGYLYFGTLASHVARYKL